MKLTVKKLAKISGVSVRTLHYYDEIGLLKPAYYGDNNYRYYGEQQLLDLQQILFFRELGFSLQDVQRIISSPDFNKIEALESHRNILKGNLKQTQNLIETIDKTIAHLRGKQEMKLEEIFEGFSADKQKLYEEFLVDYGVDENVIANSKSKVKHWKKEDWLKYKAEGDKVHTDLIAAINNKLDPASKEVQEIIREHYRITCQFWTPNKKTYIGLAELYGSHPDFVQFFRNLHPQLLDYLTKAMQIFAEQELE